MNILELVVSFCSGVVTPLVPLYLRYIQEKKKEQSTDIVMSHLEIQNQNQEVIDEIREELNADRVSITKFANGTDFLDNTHMLHLTVVNESNANGFENLKQDFQRIPAYLFDRILNLLKANDQYIERNSQVPGSDTIVAIRKSYGINTVIGIKLYSKKGKWIGILKVGFNEDRVVDSGDVGWLLVKSRQIS
jgi:hypothetical protein